MSGSSQAHDTCPGGEASHGFFRSCKCFTDVDTLLIQPCRYQLLGVALHTVAAALCLQRAYMVQRLEHLQLTVTFQQTCCHNPVNRTTNPTSPGAQR